QRPETRNETLQAHRRDMLLHVHAVQAFPRDLFNEHVLHGACIVLRTATYSEVRHWHVDTVLDRRLRVSCRSNSDVRFEHSANSPRKLDRDAWRHRVHGRCMLEVNAEKIGLLMDAICCDATFKEGRRPTDRSHRGLKATRSQTLSNR